ncbi:MAG: hypothetical protein NT084_11575 [Bacteroidetes bacterium]|nr:hypothetical protein [Bacteroidota bacterium]
MKYFISTILAFTVIVFSTTSVSAQTKTKKASITEGPEIEAKRSSVQDICGYDESGYYIVRTQKRDLFLEHINKQMVVDKSVEIPKQKDGDNPMYYDYTTMLDGHLFIFSNSKDSRLNKMTLFVQSVSISTLQIDNKPKEIASSTYENRRGMMQAAVYSGNLFSHSISPDETQILIYSTNQEKDENGALPTNTKFHLAVFDATMEKKWEKDIKLPFDPSIFSVEQIKVNDVGDVYLIGIEYQEKSDARVSRREGKPSYTYHLFRYAANGSDVLEMPVDLKGKFITDLQIDGAPNGDIIAAGFYSEKNSFSIKGAFYIALDAKTHEVKTQQITEFETDFITQYYTEKEKRKEKRKEDKGEEPELYQFRLDELLTAKDGGVTLIAEQYFVNVVTYTTYDPNTHSSSTHTTYYYNYNDILVINFNKTGQIVWKTRIPKRQCTANDGGYYSSYNFSIIGDKIYFIFNDNPKNLFLKGAEQPFPFTGSKELAVVLVEVNSDGQATRELLLTTEKGDLIVRPKMCMQTGAKEVFICSQISKVYQFGKVEFK